MAGPRPSTDKLRILVSWHTDSPQLPPFRLGPRQVTLAPALDPTHATPRRGPGIDGLTPPGRYDLGAAVARLGLAPDFDLVVVCADAGRTNYPVNLEAFSCPKLLFAADTHHQAAPLATMLAYFAEAPFDAVVTSYNRHHLHWFAAAGAAAGRRVRAAWIPGLPVHALAVAPPAAREPRLVFVGQTGKHHPRRVRLLEMLRAAGLPGLSGGARHDEAAALYAGSAVAFNASLNGDLNLRVFEILAAGGCLLTDRLAPEAGQALLLAEGRDFVTYDGPEELVAKARALLAEAPRAQAIAERGRRRYWENFAPERQAAALLDWFFEDRLAPLYRPEGDPRFTAATGAGTAVPLADRVAVYEALQALHRSVERPRVLFAAELDPVHAADARDLPRLERRVEPLAEAPAGPWDAVVLPPGTVPPPGLRAERLLPAAAAALPAAADAAAPSASVPDVTVTQLLRRAFAELEAGRALEAEGLCNEALSRGGAPPKALILAAHIALALGKKLIARKRAEAAVAAGSAEPETIFQGALLLARLGQLERAAALLRAVAPRHPTPDAVAAALAQVEAARGRKP